MSNEVKSQKLDSIAKCLNRIHEKCPASLAHLESDIDVQDILMINLERLVQLSVDVGSIVIAEKSWHPMPDSMASVFEILHQKGVLPKTLAEGLKKAVGFRNLAVHEYDKINWSLVWDVVNHHVNDFKKYAGLIDAIDLKEGH